MAGFRRWDYCQRLLGHGKSLEGCRALHCRRCRDLRGEARAIVGFERALRVERCAMLHFSRAHVRGVACSLPARTRGAPVNLPRRRWGHWGREHYTRWQWGYRMTGNTVEARRNYEIAEATLRKSLG